MSDVKAFGRIVFIFLPLPIFWALFDQQGSRWTFQAGRMNGVLGSFQILPDQMQVINPIMILVFIPLFDYIIYPILTKCNLLKKPLQRVVMGGFLAAASFFISGGLELQLQTTYPKLPPDHHMILNVYNGVTLPDCNWSPIPLLQDGHEVEKINLNGSDFRSGFLPVGNFTIPRIEMKCEGDISVIFEEYFFTGPPKQVHKPRTLYTHRPLPKKPRSPGPIKIIDVQVQYTNPFILLFFKILWVVRRVTIQLVAKDIIYIYVYIMSLDTTQLFLSFSFLHNLNYH